MSTWRSTLGLAATMLGGAPLLLWASPAKVQKYAPIDGDEIFAGVRRVTLGSRDSNIRAYKTVRMEDVAFQPGATIPLGDVMMDDMVCTVTEGELAIKARDMDFVAKEGDVGSCAKGSIRESAANNGAVTAVMRVINLGN